MTKHEQGEAALKAQLDLEEAGKVDLASFNKMLESNTFVFRSLETIPCSVPIGEDIENRQTNKLGKVGRKLYDLEQDCGPEKRLKIDLDLYQMEDV